MKYIDVESEEFRDALIKHPGIGRKSLEAFLEVVKNCPGASFGTVVNNKGEEISLHNVSVNTAARLLSVFDEVDENAPD